MEAIYKESKQSIDVNYDDDLEGIIKNEPKRNKYEIVRYHKMNQFPYYLLGKVISKFENDSDDYLRRVWNDFKKCRVCHKSDHLIKGKYCINVKSKARYVNPLVLINDKPIRIYDASKRSKNYIDKFLSLPRGGNYTYFNFEFTPYK